MSLAITFDELEGRSDAASSFAIKAKLALCKSHSHVRALINLELMKREITSLLSILHDPKIAPAIEQADPEILDAIAGRMESCHFKIKTVIPILSDVDVPFWSSLYHRCVVDLEVRNTEIQTHIFALKNSPLLLSKDDQSFLLEALLEGSESNEALQATANKVF